MGKPREKRDVEKCITCDVSLSEFNTDYLWQRRCDNCVGEIEIERLSKGERNKKKRRENVEAKKVSRVRTRNRKVE